jgi:tetrahydromethanopterin S-methyltransferase subunit B
VTWTLETPNVWTDEYLFVRLAEQYDYGAGAIELLAGETLRIRPDTGASDGILDTTGAWELHDPTQSEPLYSHAGEKAAGFILDFFYSLVIFGIVIGPIVTLLLFVLQGRMVEQVIYWGGILVWLLVSIGIAATPDSEAFTEESDPDPSERQTSQSIPSVDVSSAALSELTDELYTVERQTDNGWFAGEVTQIEPTAEGEQLAMSVMLANNGTVTWTLETPNDWTDEYLFVRLAEQYDYGAGAIELLVGETLRIRPDTGASDGILDTTSTWELHDPARSDPQASRGTIRGFITDIVAGLLVFGVIIGSIMAILLFVFPDGLVEQVIYWGGILAWILASVGKSVSRLSK